jgi:hypothetical protein
MFRYLPSRMRLRLVKSVLGPSGAWWLRDRVDGQIDIRIGQRIRSASLGDGRVLLHLSGADGSRSDLEVDHVIAATGYRVDLDTLEFLEPDLRARLHRVGGSPRLTGAFESSTPGLFFTGLPAAATFGPLLRFVCGTGFAARRVSAGLVSRRRRSVRV